MGRAVDRAWVPVVQGVMAPVARAERDWAADRALAPAVREESDWAVYPADQSGVGDSEVGQVVPVGAAGVWGLGRSSVITSLAVT